MSRSKRGGKPIGYEFWSARPFNRNGGTPNRYHKTRTHKAERQQSVDEVESLLDEIENDDCINGLSANVIIFDDELCNYE